MINIFASSQDIAIRQANYGNFSDFWPHHVNASEPLSPEIWSQISKFFSTRTDSNGGNFSNWIGVLTKDSTSARKSEPLYYAASFGMTEVVQRLIDENPDINLEARGGRGLSSALHVAVYRAQNKVVKILVAAGADVNNRSVYGESVLYWTGDQKTHRAAYNEEIRTLLQERGAVLLPREARGVATREKREKGEFANEKQTEL